MKIKLTSAEAIRLVRILNYSDADLLSEEGGVDADTDLQKLDKVWKQLRAKLHERGITVSDYAGAMMRYDADVEDEQDEEG